MKDEIQNKLNKMRIIEVKRVMEDLGLSKAGLARETGFSKSYVYKALDGTRIISDGFMLAVHTYYRNRIRKSIQVWKGRVRKGNDAQAAEAIKIWEKKLDII